VRAFPCFALILLAGCTFYSGVPNNNNNNNGAGAPGTAGSAAGGSRPGSGGGNGSDAGTGGTDDIDAGPAWVPATGTLAGKANASPGITYLSVKPDEDVLIAGLAENGLWASKDGGETWEALGTSGTSDAISNGVTQILYDPKHPQVYWETGIYIGAGAYRTDDNGKTFKQLGSASHIEMLSVDFSDPKRQTILAGPHETQKLVHISHDAGKTWADIGQNLPDECFYSSFPLVLDKDTFLLGCVTRIMRSEDGGATWETVSANGGSNAPMLAQDGSIYWGSNGFGVMHSEDQGLTWKRVVGGGVLQDSRLLQLPDGRLASMTKDYVVVSSDGGNSWQVFSPKLPYPPVGFTYSPFRKSFYVWAHSVEGTLREDSVMTFPFDYETQ